MNEANLNIDICYVVSHGFAARMILQTGLVKKLADRGRRVAIVAPDPRDENLVQIAKHPNVLVFDSEIKQTIWDDDYGFKRMYYLEDMKSNPVFWEKHLYSILYSKSKHPWKRVRPFYYYLIFTLIKFFPIIRRKFKEKESKYLESAVVDQVLSKISPDILVSTYPINFIESKFLFAAQKKNIHTVIHLLSWDNVTSKGIFPVIPNQFIAWGPIMRDEIMEYYGVSRDDVFVTGVPHFDQHFKYKKRANQDILLPSLNLDPQKPYLVFAMSSPRFTPYEIEIVEHLANKLRDDLSGDLQMIVRPHPQNVQGSLADKSWINRLKRLENDKVRVDFPQLSKSNVRWSMKSEDMERLSQLLSGCTMCINSGSTVSIDALLFDKPVVLTPFDADRKLNYWKSARRLIDYTHQKKFIALGGVSVANSFEVLYDLIDRYRGNPNYKQAERSFALAQECANTDGTATENVLDVMEAIIIERNQEECSIEA